MAGYIFSLEKANAENMLTQYIKNGMYTTFMREVNNYFSSAQEVIFADYCRLKEGDNVYFFTNRKIYGIGSLKKVDLDCKFCNYPESTVPKIINYDYNKDTKII